MKTILLALLLTAFALPVHAQDQPSLTLPLTVFAASAATDWATTYRNLETGRFAERNPLLSGFDNRPVPTILAGAALDVAGAWAWQHYVGRNHPRLAAIGLYVAAGARIAIAAHNLSFGDGHARPLTAAICAQGVYCLH